MARNRPVPCAAASAQPARPAIAPEKFRVEQISIWFAPRQDDHVPACVFQQARRIAGRSPVLRKHFLTRLDAALAHQAADKAALLQYAPQGGSQRQKWW